MIPSLAASPRGRRIAAVLAMELLRVRRDLPERQDFLVQTWSRFRAREVFADTLFVRWRTLTAGDVAELDPATLPALHAAYEGIEELALYLRYTEDMPTTLGEHLERATRELLPLLDEALRQLGPLDPGAS